MKNFGGEIQVLAIVMMTDNIGTVSINNTDTKQPVISNDDVDIDNMIISNEYNSEYSDGSYHEFDNDLPLNMSVSHRYKLLQINYCSFKY